MRIRKKELVILSVIFLSAFALRSYKISDYLFFGFEQGRDAQIIEKIYRLQDFVLVGPSTSIGGLFHGPWYYYLLALPYWLTSGNPLAASIFLIILGSLLPVVIYFFAKEIFNSKFWGVVSAVITIFSYEYILYSRWLSNVSPAPLYVALAFLMLWIFIKKNQAKYFLGFVLFAAIATSFQMILLVQFIFAAIVLFSFKLIKILNLKTVLFSLLIIFITFFPLILFDFRNQHITFNSLFNFGNDSLSRDSGGYSSGVAVFFTQMRNHISLSTININYLWSQLLMMVFVILGTIVGYKNQKERNRAIFLYNWGLMSLPLIWVSPGNPQYYVGAGLGWIMLFSLALKTFWEAKKLKVISIIMACLFFAGIVLGIYNLNFNKNVFFRTFQDDLNYGDQKSILNFINKDSKNNPYRLVAFTIPSLHPEAWDYLHQYLYPENRSENAKIVYVVIEKYVYPVWEEKWINDLGKTDLLWEKKFGLLRLQKRVIIN